MRTRRVGSVFANFDGILGCLALAVVILSVTYGVAMRYLFGDPPVWTNEVSAIAFTWIVFLGASAAYKRKMHIGIDLLVNRLPPGVRWNFLLAAQLVLSVFFGYMVVYGVIFSIESYAQPTSILRLPNTVFYSAVPVSFALMLFHQVGKVWAHFQAREEER